MDSINHSHRGFFIPTIAGKPKAFFHPYSVEQFKLYGYETVHTKDFGMACKLAKG
jgi:hypothetical protein